MSDTPFLLAVCAEMVYLDQPIGTRLRNIRDHGFAAELWTAQDHDLDELLDARADGVDIVSMAGYLRGTLADAVGAKATVETAKGCVELAQRLGVRHLNLHGTGLGPGGIPVLPNENPSGGMWARAALTLVELAELGAREDVIFELENLNLAVDHPGTPFATAADVLELIEAVDHPNLQMNLDLYHAQIDEGNLIELCRRALPVIGQVQVADVPGRCEPGTGEIYYPAIARALVEMEYDGIVALEAYASSDPNSALERFRQAFTLTAN